MNNKEVYVRLFQEHAVESNDGVSYMDLNGFLDAVVPTSNNASSSSEAVLSTDSYKLLFGVADTKKAGRIDQAQWLTFVDTLERPDAEFLVAFKIFDYKNKGVVTLDDFQEVYYHNKSSQSLNFNFNTLFSQLYFGKNKVAPYSTFCQMLNGFSLERAKQMFLHFDKSGSGFISISDFNKLVRSLGKHKLSTQFMDKVVDIMYHESCQDGKVNFATVNAFFNIIRRSELIRQIARQCANSEGYFSRHSFNLAAASILEWQLPSPLEIDLLFYFAGVTVSGEVGSLDAFNNLFDPMWEDKKLLYKKNKASFSEEVTSSAKSFALGCAAGALGAAAVYPIDLIKTRMQRPVSYTHLTLPTN